MIDCKMAVTVRLAVPTTAPRVALIFVTPEIRPVASPPEPMLATAGVVELQMTNAVMLEVTPPLKVPVAENCCCAPVLIDATLGATAMAVNPVNEPVPVKGAVCGLFAALSTTVSVPVRVLSPKGVNRMLMLH